MSEVEALHEEMAKLRGQLAERDARLVELAASEARLKVALLEIEQIKMQLAVLRRHRYGQSSERLDGEIVQLELRLEDLEETVGEQIAASPRSREAKGQERKPTGRKPLPPHLPREVVVHEPDIICQCGGCDPGRLTKIGETTSEVLEKIPARLKVIRHVRPKYACRRCEAVFQAPAPDLPIEKGRPGPGLLAHIAVSKYCDGLPLYRKCCAQHLR